MVLDDSVLLVERESERALPGWVPRRLGNQLTPYLLSLLMRMQYTHTHTHTHMNRGRVWWQEGVWAVKVWGQGPSI